jgi:hypothetical protein
MCWKQFPKCGARLNYQPMLSSLFCECPHLVGLTQHEVGGDIYVGKCNLQVVTIPENKTK